MFEIRRIQAEDHPFVLRLNEENVEVLAPMDEARLEMFERIAELFYVGFADGKPAAFLIALREGRQEYDSENYIWFSHNYPEFLYIDRIVIDAPFRGMGLGEQLYKEVFRHAAETGVSVVTCEVDTVPYNGPSLKFHEAMGFREVGEQFTRGGSVKVSLQAVSV